MKATIRYVFALLFAALLSPGVGLAQDAPVTPYFDGLTFNEATGTYFARFGYHNENEIEIEIPVGPDNYFSRGERDRGQVTVFQPGRVYDAFTVELQEDQNLNWKLRGPDKSSSTSTAPTAYGVRNVEPIVENGGVVNKYDFTLETFLAEFGYNNPNPFSIEVAIGSRNRFSDGPEDQGQVTVFEEGRQVKAFSVPLAPGQSKTWTLTSNKVTATAPEEIPENTDNNIDPVGGYIPDPNAVESEVVDPIVENVLSFFNELDSIKQKLIQEAYLIDVLLSPDGTRNLAKVQLEFQFSSVSNKQQTYQILKSALGFSDQDSLSNADQYKLTLLLDREIALLIQNDEALALIDPSLVLGDNPLIEVVELRSTPFTTSGIVTTQGDTAQGSAQVRAGWGMTGQGVVMGILSDSYDNLGGAAAGVAQGELPANVQVLKDYPGSDEGRAMAEIVHDVAPGIDQIKFHTAFESEGDFAQGIVALADAGSDMIVDDVTYPTAPWYSDGPVSRAVSEVVDRGLIYLTSAGNFYARSAEGVFTAAPSVPEGLPFPEGLEVHAIDGGTQVLQSVKLDSGIHILAFQWDNPFVTDGGIGATDDLDIYVLNKDNTVRAGKQKNNLGNDPWEFFAFEVKEATDTANIVVTRKSGNTAGLKFKYVFFRSAGVEFLSTSTDALNATTVVAHAANPDAITVAAAPYFNKTQVEPFSSKGFGTKPDFTAVDGGNTSFFGFDYEGDLLPNFFGTSAAAPHLAGLLALLSEGYSEFALEPMTLAKARQTLESAALDIGDPGFDNLSGAGLVLADAALQTLGNPSPQISQLDLLDKNDQEATFDLGINGEFFVDGQTLIRIGNDTLAPATVTDTRLTIEVDSSLNSEPIQAINPPVANSLTDGGSSEIFTANNVFYSIDVQIGDAVTTYLQGVPAFETSFSVTPTVLAEGNVLTEEDSTAILALLDNPDAFFSLATDTSSIGFYQVDFEPGELDTLEEIGFTSQPGLLLIEPLELVLQVEDLELLEGEAIGDALQYALDGDFAGIGIIDQEELLDAILAAYEANLADAVVVANFARGIVNNPDAAIDPASLAQINMLISQAALNDGSVLQENGTYKVEADSANLIALVENPDTITAAANFARGIVNGNRMFDPYRELFLDYDDDGDPNTNFARAIVNFARGIVNGGEVGDAEILLNIARGIVNDENLDEESLRNFARGIVNAAQQPDSDALSNFARGIVNEGLIDEPGSLLNFARGIVNEENPGPEAFSNFARAIVNLARAIVNISGRAIVNFGGRAIVNGKSLEGDNPFYAMIAVSDTARLNASGDPNAVEFFSVPLVTGDSIGEHVIVPGSVVLTNQTVPVLVNTGEGTSEVISLPLGNFIFTTYSGKLKVKQDINAPGIQSFVWDDLNNNGIQDPGEPGLEGVKVQLLLNTSEDVLRTTYSNEDGIAYFGKLQDLHGEKVRMRYFAVDGYELVIKDLGNDDTIDSDANRSNDTGDSNPFFLNANKLTTKWDAGYVSLALLDPSSQEVSTREETVLEPEMEGAFQVFPNPATADVFITMPQGLQGEGNLRLLDATGKLLWDQKIALDAGSSFRMDFSGLPGGMYFVRVSWEDGSRLIPVVKK